LCGNNTVKRMCNEGHVAFLTVVEGVVLCGGFLSAGKVWFASFSFVFGFRNEYILLLNFNLSSFP